MLIRGNGIGVVRKALTRPGRLVVVVVVVVVVGDDDGRGP